MRRTPVLILLVAAFAAATSPVWADAGNPAFTPDTAYPGQTVTFSGTLNDAYGSGPCEVSLDWDFSCSYGDSASMSGWVLVPTSATPGTYRLGFCGPVDCFSEGGKSLWSLTGDLEVTATPSTVLVPNVHCEPYAVASSVLAADGLYPPKAGFPPVVGGQRPTAGATVTPPRGVELLPALVPTLVPLPYASARLTALRACGAELVAVGGTAGAVTSQTPAAGSLLPAGRSITVYVSPIAAATSTSSGTVGTGTTGGHGHHLHLSALVTRGGPPASALLVVGVLGLLGRRRWRVAHLPLVDPATCVVRVGKPSYAVSVAEAVSRRLPASLVTVRHDRPTTIEELP